MGRLIDADALIEVLAKYKFGCLSHEVEREYIKETIIDFVKTEPTAYDVEKVVAEIKKIHCKKCRNILGVAGAEEYCKGQKCEIEELCDIARKGGVE